MNHKHRCPRHGEYICAYVTQCGVKEGRVGLDYHCPKCIEKRYAKKKKQRKQR